MSTSNIAFCGFADVLAHLNCKSVHQLREYNKDIGTMYPAMHIAEIEWQKRRKKLEESISTL
jgi:hypothetical protein